MGRIIENDNEQLISSEILFHTTFEGRYDDNWKFEWLLEAMKTYDPLNIDLWPVAYSVLKLLDPKYNITNDVEV